MLQFAAQREIDAAILDISGRQRMLSQRIALLLTQLASCQDSAKAQIIRQELQSTLQLFVNSHQALIQGDRDLKLPSYHSPEIEVLYWQPPVNLNQQLQDYVQQVQGYLDSSIDLAEPNLQTLTTVTAKQLLRSLDLVVKQYAQESENRQMAMINQLIHAEKMNGLGQLVAGIAHEINNPINFIHGNLNHATNYSQDLVQLLRCYQMAYPEANEVIQACEEEIDAEYLMTDFPQLMQSMRSGTERVRSIVLSLRLFARLDESDWKAVKLQDGLESSLLFIQHRLQEFQTQGLVIQIHQDYQELPLVLCSAGQINQVFMALLDNAIDAIVAKFLPASMENATVHPTITLKININPAAKMAEVGIIDNGIGITETVQPQIFNPFFTTKPVGQGTGLGLAVCDRIIAQHRGKLLIQSLPGQGTEAIVQLPIVPG
jgi:two-component system, NtrC family, sensor kinase